MLSVIILSDNYFSGGRGDFRNPCIEAIEYYCKTFKKLLKKRVKKGKEGKGIIRESAFQLTKQGGRLPLN